MLIGKPGKNINKNTKRPKITFRPPIRVPGVSFWEFWWLVCFEKWSYNFEVPFLVPLKWAFLAILVVLGHIIYGEKIDETVRSDLKMVQNRKIS